MSADLENVKDSAPAAPEALEAPEVAKTHAPEASAHTTTPLKEEPQAQPEPPLSPFERLGLKPWLSRAVEGLGYHTPTPIQAECLPLLLDGQDLIGQAQTGTGKTAAFALPLIQLLPKKKRRPPTPSALVLAPTRELAIQVASSVASYGGAAFDREVALLYGGQPIGPQIGALRQNPAIVIGTPGRVIDHLNRGTLDLSEARFVVLDEADEMLKMGFVDDVTHILSQTSPERQSALFSATMPPEVKRIAEQFLKPERAHVKVQGERRSSDDVEQLVLFSPREGKVAALAALLELTLEGVRIVFARTRQDTTQLVDALAKFGHQAEALNGEMGQQLREAVVNRLREGTLNTLIATDVAARGLDIDNVSLVVNFDLPFDSESYIHRVGRTGRAGQKGRAVSLVEPRDKRSLFHLERKLSQTLTPHPPIHPNELLEARKTSLKLKLQEQLKRLSPPELKEGQESQEAQEAQPISPYHEVMYELLEAGLPLQELAAAALSLAATDRPLERSTLPLRYAPDARDPRKERKERRREDRQERRRAPYQDERPSRSQQREPREQSRGEAPLRRGGSSGPMTLVELNVGRANRVRPKDLVGAIANEGRVDGREIGAIKIDERRSLVELPSEAVDRVMKRLSGRFVCGVKVKLRLAHTP